jgi:cytidine deaminase
MTPNISLKNLKANFNHDGAIMNKLKKNHFYLIETAKKIINARFKENRHHFVAAFRTVSGEYTPAFTSELLKKDDVCAEVVALANAFANGEVDIECIVVLNRIGDIIAPCGIAAKFS